MTTTAAAADDVEPSPPEPPLPVVPGATSTQAQDADPQSLLLPPEDDALRLLSRSPHPYHRRSIHSQSHKEAPSQLAQSQSQTGSGPPSPSSPWSSGGEYEEEGEGEEQKAAVHHGTGAADSSRVQSRSISESGTEADDEGYAFVKALPPAPIRPHKGLRDVRGSGLSESPLLTPSMLDDEGVRLNNRGYFARPGARKTAEATSLSDEEVRREREKFVKRRRAELLRRGCEVALVGAIAALVLRGAETGRGLSVWNRELSSYVVVYATLLILYPLRLLFFPRDGHSQVKKRIRIPAAFDPAPLIYPAVLPILVSLSLYPRMERILLPNIVLSLAALPPRLIPSFGQGSGYSLEHWFTSLLPLMISEHTDIPSKIRAAKPYLLKAPADGVPPDVIACLFFLHQALLPPIHYLTTTSLLSAELHLLSISLINLLLFSQTPQMTILNAVIWIGGLCLFFFCGHVLRWGVALARIPKWRFRRAGQIIRARQSFLAVLNQALRGRSTASPSRRKDDISDSDADEDDFLLQQHDDLSLKPVESAPGTMQSIAAATANGPLSAIEAVRDAIFPPQDANKRTLEGRKRSNTLPDQNSARFTSGIGSRKKRTRSSYAQSFLALTPAQAAFRKWLYAGYVYITMVLIVLVPIREYISKYALNGNEPFGWAIGYLFGNIRDVRFWIMDWNLKDWIALPDLPDSESELLASYGRAEHYRHIILGEANTRLLITGYWVSILVIGLIIVLRLSTIAEVDTRRKVFHGMMVAMLLPTIFIDPCFVALTLALVLAVFLLLDLIRASQLPPLSKPIAYFLTPYVDGRDLRGPVVVSHIFLLIGCAIPLWLSLAGARRAGEWPWADWDVEARDVSMVAGVVCVGMGDAAASLIGRRYGRRKWPWLGGKSLEGSVAFASAVVVGLVFGKVWLRLGQWGGDEGVGVLAVGDVARAAVAGCAASFMEAVLTGGNDNVIVPVVLWLVVRGVGL